MMGAITWISGVGLPVLIGSAAFAGAAFAWFRLPVFGHYAGLALALIGVGFLAHANGYATARGACQEASLRAELAQTKADLKNAQNAAARAREMGDRLDAAEALNSELAHELATRPEPDVCRNATDGDVNRLRAIR
ncbi:MAG: hypothetical protein Q8M31_21550 [Beijerinckiaceae bacterium]|nr:hypothetical protein [Beijerinckiaceae bacterium]